MASKIKFPTLSTRDLSRVVDDWRQVPINDTTVLNEGLFVAVWDSDNPEDAYPTVLPLHAITTKARLETTYTVLNERGFEMTYKHAALIDESRLPFVVVKECFNHNPTVGRFIGCFLDDENRDWICAVRIKDSPSICFPKPSEVVFTKDVNFGIVEEDNGNC